MPRPLRTFVAVELTDSIRRRAADLIDRLRGTPAKVKWTAPQNLHVTLKFLGDVDPRDVPHVCARVAEAAATVPPFDFECRGAGAFPDGTRPRTIWLGAGRGESEMVALHAAVEQQLKDMGIRVDHRRFHPHTTIGRVRQGRGGTQELAHALAAAEAFEAGQVRVEEVALFSSQLTSEGPVYEHLCRAPLGGS